MNYILETKKVWIFPENISYESVPGYLSAFNEQNGITEIIFDLSATERIHASFIGFLLHTKQTASKKNRTIKIILSPGAKNILNMLNLHDFLVSAPEEEKTAEKRRSA
jgi:anti-anti-sigma regulatory factor